MPTLSYLKHVFLLVKSCSIENAPMADSSAMIWLPDGKSREAEKANHRNYNSF